MASSSVLAAAALAAAIAQPDALAAPGGTFTTVDDVAVVAARAESCRTQACAAFRDVSAALTALRKSFTPNTMVHLAPYDPQADLGRALDRSVFRHPQRYRADCLAVRGIAARSVGREAVFATMTLAARLAVRRPGCSAQAIAALPKLPEVEQTLRDFHETCEVDRRLRCGG